MHPSRRTQGPAELVLGTMNFGRRTPRPEALALLDQALDAGIRWLDTANLYTDGESERILGTWLRGRREQVYLATKVGAGRVAGKAEGLSAARIQAACDESLGRLQTDVIDLYYLHVPDPHTPLEDSLAGVQALLAAGKIRQWGVSNHASWQVERLRHLALAAGLPAPAVAQQLFNVLVRQLELEWFRFAADVGLHTTVYNPLAGGLLTGLHHPDTTPRGSRFDGNALYRRRYWTPALFAAVEELRALATAHDRSLVSLAYGALFHHPGVDSVLVGPATTAHLRDALVAQAQPMPDALADAVRKVWLARQGTDASYAR
jgi:aryl-alcohol dehydrogenase-like predicted oxidoreductase